MQVNVSSGIASLTPARRWVLLGLGALAALIVIAYLGAALSSGDTAAPGTTVQGVAIGGMTQDVAATAVQEEIGPTAAKKLRVTALGETFVVKPAEAGLKFDAAASVAPAFGRKWNPVDLVAAVLWDSRFPGVVAVDDSSLSVQLATIAETLDIAPVEPTLVLDAGQPVLTEGTPGRALDREGTATALADALLLPREPIEATVVKVDPIVTPAAAQQAVGVARAAISAPVTVRAETITASIPTTAIERALSFTEQGAELVPVLDGAVLHRSIRKVLKPIEVKGRDATFKIRRGKPKVVKSKVGTGVADDELATAVAAVLDKPSGQRTVTVSVGVREPKLSTEEAKALGITERLSTFTQNYPYAPYRSQNIGQAAERVNGTLLRPGETFSLNDTIKERTEKNGYTEGFVVGEGGVFAEALGGGVSTSATAVWTAAFYAGMERVQTVAHSIYISRYSPGLEATVAWGIFDMKFRNDLPTGVFITSSTTPTSITVSLWGTKAYDDIEADFGEKTSIVPFEKIYDQSDTCLGQNGVDGFTITVDRVFYKDGEEVRREPITTRYKPAPDVTCGKKPVDKPGKKPGKNGPSATPTPTPTPTVDNAPAEEPVPDDSGTFTNPSPSPSATKPPRN